MIQVAAFGLVGVVLITLLRSRSGELALLLSLAVCVLLGLMLVRVAEPVISLLRSLQRIAQIEDALMRPVLKTLGIGMITQIAANVCVDGGESAVARMIELCGTFLALYAAIPLLEAVLDLVRNLSGG